MLRRDNLARLARALKNRLNYAYFILKYRLHFNPLQYLCFYVVLPHILARNFFHFTLDSP
nr:MAG TPA: hypothetical protein [Caudoviricetes sp.]